MNLQPNILSPALREALSGKWKLELLYGLSRGTVRWSVLTHSIPAAAPNVLTRQLRGLQKDGLVLRIVTAAHSPQIIEYALSEEGRLLEPTLEALAHWDMRYRNTPDSEPDFSACQRVLAGRWMFPIMALLPAPLRFGALQERLEDISRGVLAAQLGELRDMELIHQIRYNIFPPRVEYVLTAKGRELLNILDPEKI